MDSNYFTEKTGIPVNADIEPPKLENNLPTNVKNKLEQFYKTK